MNVLRWSPHLLPSLALLCQGAMELDYASLNPESNDQVDCVCGAKGIKIQSFYGALAIHARNVLVSARVCSLVQWLGACARE